MIVFTETGQLLKIVLNQFFSNFLGEALALIILSIAFVGILITRLELLNYFKADDGQDSKSDTLRDLLLEISIPLIYFVLLKYISSHFQNVRVSFLLFNSFIYLYFGFIIVNYAKNIPTIYENHIWVKALYVLVVIAAIAHLFVNLAVNFYNMQELLNSLMFILENSVKYVFFIIFFRGIRYLIDRNQAKFGVAGIILNKLYPIMYFLYMAMFVTLLWLIVIVKLNYSYFVGIVSVVVLITVFALIRAYILPVLKRSQGNYGGSYNRLSQSLQIVAILIAAWSVYNISIKHFKFDLIVKYMSEKYLIITDLVEISYFSLISDAFVFLMFVSLIGLLKNMITFYETSKSFNRLRGT